MLSERPIAMDWTHRLFKIEHGAQDLKPQDYHYKSSYVLSARRALNINLATKYV